MDPTAPSSPQWAYLSLSPSAWLPPLVRPFLPFMAVVMWNRLNPGPPSLLRPRHWFCQKEPSTVHDGPCRLRKALFPNFARRGLHVCSFPTSQPFFSLYLCGPLYAFPPPPATLFKKWVARFSFPLRSLEYHSNALIAVSFLAVFYLRLDALNTYPFVSRRFYSLTPDIDNPDSWIQNHWLPRAFIIF